MIATGASGPVVHRLVQEAVRNRLRPDQTAKWSEAAVRLMKAAFPFVEDDPATWAASGELLGHASAAAQYADQQASAETAAALHDHLGTYLRTRGEFVRARRRRMSGRWPSTSAPTAPSTRTWRSGSTTWAWCCEAWATWPGRGRRSSGRLRSLNVSTVRSTQRCASTAAISVRSSERPVLEILRLLSRWLLGGRLPVE
jgi:hypothetical protein